MRRGFSRRIRVVLALLLVPPAAVGGYYVREVRRARADTPRLVGEALAVGGS